MKTAIPKALKSKIVWRGNDRIPGPLLTKEEAMEMHRRNWEAADKQVVIELNEKLLLLAAFRGVDTSEPFWQHKLCLILAADKYPGFQVVEKAVGRPSEWEFRRYARLICDVERTKREIIERRGGKITDSHAITALVRRCIKSQSGEYLPSRGQSEAAWIKTLKNKLAEATDREKNPMLSILLRENPEYREAILDQMIPCFASPEGK
ncbi:hypothetical protein WDZ92_45775 [Nostoc sp. NIES-2111]